MNKEQLKTLTNEELFKMLNDVEWLDRDLLREYDERSHDGRIQFTPIDNLEEHFKKRREEIEKRKAS